MRAQRKTYKPIWDVDKIQEYFAGIVIPETPVRLNACTVVVDVRKMINAHIEVIRAQNGNPTYKRFYIRLKQLKKVLLDESKQE